MKIGSRVKFKKLNGSIIPKYECENIAGALIKHGSTQVGEKYRKKGAIIKGENGDYWIVEYISNYNKPVCLGFRKDLIIPFALSWKERFEK